MIQSATATIYVSDMDRAVEFYTGALGLPLSGRWGNEFAAIDTGRGIAIGLHPARKPPAAQPGTMGAIQVGFTVDRPLEEVVGELRKRGVQFRGEIVDDGQVRAAFFGDPDGNDLYLIEVKNWK